MKTRLSPKLEWLGPYLELGMTYISDERKFVARVGSWNLGKSRGKQCAAALFQDRVGDHYRIWIHTHFEPGVPHSKIDILKLLAHELAHMEDWKHTPKHELLCSRITVAFMRMLKQEGYESEEAELRTK
jgi:hypothetical protein